jgi:hypothetical protein
VAIGRDGYTLRMRVLAIAGFLLFAYLAVIPAGLVGATLDPACAGGDCESVLVVRIGFAALYGACCVALAVTAVAFAGYGLRPTVEGLRMVGRALTGAAVVIGVALFGILALSYPLAGAALAAGGVIGYLWLRRLRPSGTLDAGSNGHGRDARLG